MLWTARTERLYKTQAKACKYIILHFSGFCKRNEVYFFMEDLKLRLQLLICLIGHSSELASSFADEDISKFECTFCDMIHDELLLLSESLENVSHHSNINNITITQADKGTVNISSN